MELASLPTFRDNKATRRRLVTTVGNHIIETGSYARMGVPSTLRPFHHPTAIVRRAMFRSRCHRLASSNYDNPTKLEPAIKVGNFSWPHDPLDFLL